MRPLILVLGVSALGLGSYVGLTRVWAPTPSDAVTTTVTEVAPAAAPAPAPLTTPPSTSGVQTTLVTDSYAVEGRTADDLLRSLAERGPRTDGEVFFGLTTAQLGLRYRTRTVADGCMLIDIEIDLALTETLPDWSPPADADRALVRDWGRFRRALAGHEARHREIAEDGAETVVRILDGLRRSSCDAVEAEGRHRLTRLESQIEEAQRRYDARTGHGRTEGAVWPL